MKDRHLAPPLAVALGLGLLSVSCGGSSSGTGAAASRTAPSRTAPPSTSASPSPTAPATPTSTSGAGSATPGSVAATPAPSAPLQPPSGAWLKGDFHVHSNHSGDAQPWGDDIATVIKCAEVMGLDFSTISDHRVADCLTDPQFLNAQTNLVLIPGEEWGQPGHAGAHGLTRDPIAHTQDETQGPAAAVAGIQAVIDDVHSMGGIFVINHPMDDKTPWAWPADRFDAMEAWNQSWAFRSSTDMTPQMLAQYATDHHLDQPGGPQIPQEYSNAVAVTGGGQNWQRLALYEQQVASGRHIAALGGGDSHFLVLPGQPTTQVFAAKRDMKSILDGVRAAHTIVKRAPDAPDLELTADRDGDGIFETIVGDTIPIGHAVTFKLHVTNAQDGKIDVIKCGAVFQHFDVTSNDFTVTFSDSPAAASWYRANLYEKLDLSIPHASEFRDAVLGTASFSWLTSLVQGPLAGALGPSAGKWATQLAYVINQGGAAGVMLLLWGHDMGVTVAPVSTSYPRYLFPPAVSKLLNTAVHDKDYCMSAITSPIWIQ